MTIGRSFALYRQVDNAFCDDETITGMDIQDVVRLKETIRKFVSLSGAILSRTKSKIV